MRLGQEIQTLPRRAGRAGLINQDWRWFSPPPVVCMSWIASALESLRRLWAELDPSQFVPPQPTLNRLNDNQVELAWLGHPWLFDRRSKTISRRGRAPVHYDTVRCIGISEQRDDGRPVSWSVFLEIGFLRNVVLGTTREQVDASIAAAHVARVMEKRVRVL